MPKGLTRSETMNDSDPDQDHRPDGNGREAENEDEITMESVERPMMTGREAETEIIDADGVEVDLARHTRDVEATTNMSLR